MAMQVPGSFLVCYTIAKSPGTNISSWITYFVSGCLQCVLLIICIYYQHTHCSDFVVVNNSAHSINATAQDGASPETVSDVRIIKEQLHQEHDGQQRVPLLIH